LKGQSKYHLGMKKQFWNRRYLMPEIVRVNLLERRWKRKEGKKKRRKEYKLKMVASS